MSWYPTKLLVGPEGNESTIQFIKANFEENAQFTYAEFGVYEGATALAIANAFPNSRIFLFDYNDTLSKIASKFSSFGERIRFYGNSDRFLDNYNWSLSEILNESPAQKFDYVFIDGAHTFAVDALTFLICDKMLNRGGYIDFDDHDWKLRGSSLDPTKVPQTSLLYTVDQIDNLQVKRILDLLVRTNDNYQEVIENKIFQKNKLKKNLGVLSTESTMSEEEIQFLSKFLSKSRNYLEYGAGYSTIQAAKLVSNRVVSIETCPEYSKYVMQEIQTNSFSALVNVMHTDIGPTGLWGYPISDEFAVKWNAYFDWNFDGIDNFIPDTILIDGRFRIATFADVFLRFPGATVLFDDYYDRSHYSIVEKILKPSKRCGRIALFKIPKRRSHKLISATLQLHKLYRFDTP